MRIQQVIHSTRWYLVKEARIHPYSLTLRYWIFFLKLLQLCNSHQSTFPHHNTRQEFTKLKWLTDNKDFKNTNEHASTKHRNKNSDKDVLIMPQLFQNRKKKTPKSWHQIQSCNKCFQLETSKNSYVLSPKHFRHIANYVYIISQTIFLSYSPNLFIIITDKWEQITISL